MNNKTVDMERLLSVDVVRALKDDARCVLAIIGMLAPGSSRAFMVASCMGERFMRMDRMHHDFENGTRSHAYSVVHTHGFVIVPMDETDTVEVRLGEPFLAEFLHRFREACAASDLKHIEIKDDGGIPSKDAN